MKRRAGGSLRCRQQQRIALLQWSRKLDNPLVTKLERRDRISAGERKVLEAAAGQIREFAPGEDMVQDGDRPWVSTLILEGYAARYKLLSGGSRHITALHVAGDFVDLHGFLLKHIDHGIGAISPCTIATFPHDRLTEITEKHPHLTRLLWLSTVIDASIHRQWLVALARPAVKTLAHLFCEMFVRLQSVNRVDGDCFPFSLTQSDLSEVMGISSVHVNRVVKKLRATGYATWSGGKVCILDWPRLAELAEFDPTYLNLEMGPR